jgi:hypothetical protein
MNKKLLYIKIMKYQILNLNICINKLLVLLIKELNYLFMTLIIENLLEIIEKYIFKIKIYTKFKKWIAIYMHFL